MHITKLRLVGFKSFVEPTELTVEPGLTGVVGPNGCGKSNLLEALRWVMGETSYKSMRAAAMDDVIFSGTTGRPARNMSEVTIFLDNARRDAPAEFNDQDTIEITRRIEREEGSSYLINGRGVRARDVKILFEDAATGARSPALVRQGQIGEIVNAKPEQRRRILEDAAGTAGLYSRRHEAELRLRGAENNLARLSDVIGQFNSQIDSLKRQARQANRYSELSDKIRQGEALLLYLTWSSAQVQVDHDEAALQVALEALGAATQKEAVATRQESDVSETLQPLRDEEVRRAAVLARLNHEQTNLDNDLRRARQRAEELGARAAQFRTDIEREIGLVDEARQLREQIELELKEDVAREKATTKDELQLTAQLETAEGRLADAEQVLASLISEHAKARAQRGAVEAQVHEREAMVARLEQQKVEISRQTDGVMAAAPDAAKLAALQQEAVQLNQAIESVDERAPVAEERVAKARVAVQSAQEERSRTQLALRQIATERQTLAQLVQTGPDDVPVVVDRLKVKKGYEIALGAALGDDLDVPVGVEDVVHWRAVAEAELPAHDPGNSLPDGVEPLAKYVSGAPELERRLQQIGVVDHELGRALQMRLMPGQRLVSRRGDLWRWDGLTAPADAPTPAAQRLAARNRLAELEVQEKDATAVAEAANAATEKLAEALQSAVAEEQDLRRERRDGEARLGNLSQQLRHMEQAASETQSRLASLQDASAAVAANTKSAREQLTAGQRALNDLPPPQVIEAKLSDAQELASQCRDGAVQLRSQVQALVLQRQRFAEQRERLRADQERWSDRLTKGEAQVAALQSRLLETESEKQAVSAIPGQLETRRQKLLDEVTTAEAARQQAADELAIAETALKDANTALRGAQTNVSECREIRARADAKMEASRQRRAEIVRQIQETFDSPPEGCLKVAGHEPDDDLPELADAEARVLRLKTDRERLGGVNLQASEELDTLSEQFEKLTSEHADVEEAIAKLRAGIASLNREGRRRLKAAFEAVDAHFQDLFTTLFGGGEAKLELIEDDSDPLAGGLEILAKPPGKKPTTLSLLSGGEQTLTALSLIFAVFLTNPSPICVLDEVDAPLDDANVDRFCTLMEKMVGDTDTRFLVITHHPMTMARVDRLFGVTMVERGVSQLVSVDLAAAEQFLEAG
ncbi:MAG: chromosome segregation protein SMC [Hyphomicrobiaceae bacterium]